MPKVKKTRQKLHISNNTKATEFSGASNINEMQHTLLTIQNLNYLFSEVDIDVNKLNRTICSSNDVQSVKSFKSAKSDISRKVISKKDKLIQRRKMLMCKVDAVNQMKKQANLRKKRRNNSIIGDTNPLHDALPSLESLLKTKSEKIKKKDPKPKAILSSTKRKKNLLHGIETYKKLLNKKLNKNIEILPRQRHSVTKPK